MSTAAKNSSMKVDFSNRIETEIFNIYSGILTVYKKKSCLNAYTILVMIFSDIFKKYYR